MNVKRYLCGIAAFGVLAMAGLVNAGSLDLTSGSGGTAPNYNILPFAGAGWQTTSTQPAGSGVINPFVRIDGNHNGMEQGFNSTAGPAPQYDETNSFDFALPFNDLQSVTVNSTSYYVFLLDINQETSSPDLSLNSLKIYLSGTPNVTVQGGTKSPGPFTGFDQTTTLAYDMGAGNVVYLNYNQNTTTNGQHSGTGGSGVADLQVYIPTADFVNGKNQYVVLYSQFGASGVVNGTDFSQNDGYEEWAALTGQNTPLISGVPLPGTASMGIVLLVVLGAGGFVYRRYHGVP